MQFPPFRPRTDLPKTPATIDDELDSGAEAGADAPEPRAASGPVNGAPIPGDTPLPVPDPTSADPGLGVMESGAAAADPKPSPWPSPVTVAPVVVPRWIQLVLLPLALLGLWELAKAAGTVFLVLIAAAIVAMILNPMAKRMQRWIPRALAIVASYLVVLVLFAAIVAALSAPVTNQVGHFSSHLPYYTNQANRELTNVQNWLTHHGINIHIQKQGSTALQSLEKRLTQSSSSIVSVSRDVLGKVLSLGVDLILTFVLSVYFLVYARPIGELVRRIMPPGDGTPGDDYPLLMQRAVSGYVRGQLLFSFVMGSSAALSLWVLGLTNVFPDGAKYAVFFGLFYGLMELVPYIGPILGPIPAVLVALFTNPLSAVWVLLLFVALQQLEGHVVAPQIFRISLRINPILVILALLLGYQIYGIVGALVALPVATIIRQTVIYLKRHLILEPWSKLPPPL